MHYGHLYFEADLMVLRRKISCVYETNPDGKTIMGKGIWILGSCRGEREGERERERENDTGTRALREHRCFSHVVWAQRPPQKVVVLSKDKD